MCLGERLRTLRWNAGKALGFTAEHAEHAEGGSGCGGILLWLGFVSASSVDAVLCVCGLGWWRCWMGLKRGVYAASMFVQCDDERTGGCWGVELWLPV